MSCVSETELAWHLAEAHRDCLADASATMVFVNLGAGDFVAVIRDVLKAVAAQGNRLSPQTAQWVRAWMDSYSQHTEFHTLLTAVVD